MADKVYAYGMHNGGDAIVKAVFDEETILQRLQVAVDLYADKADDEVIEEFLDELSTEFPIGWQAVLALAISPGESKKRLADIVSARRELIGVGECFGVANVNFIAGFGRTKEEAESEFLGVLEGAASEVIQSEDWK